MRLVVLTLGLVVALGGPGWAEGVAFPAAATPSVCRTAIRQLEGASGGTIPDHLLAAIAHVESGRRDPQTGRFVPWPWTINAEGQGFFFESKAEAIAAVHDLQSRGVRSIDVGCMQINLMHHPNAFGSLEQAFDPPANAAYAARFLMQLHDQAGDWTRATGMYHSATPELGADYARQVQAALPAEAQEAGGGAPMQLASATQFASTTQFASATQFGMPAHFAAPMQTATAWHGAFATAQPAAHPAVAVPFSAGDRARIIPSSTGPGSVGQGRSLDAYRAAPIALASRLFHSPGG